jgi:hypothetical protein
VRAQKRIARNPVRIFSQQSIVQSALMNPLHSENGTRGRQGDGQEPTKHGSPKSALKMKAQTLHITSTTRDCQEPIVKVSFGAR